MFWNKLTKQEAERYHQLSLKFQAYIAWKASEPDKPSDPDLHEMERLAMKGWGMKI